MFKTVNELYSKFDLHAFTRSIALITDLCLNTGTVYKKMKTNQNKIHAQYNLITT